MACPYLAAVPETEKAQPDVLKQLPFLTFWDNYVILYLAICLYHNVVT